MKVSYKVLNNYLLNNVNNQAWIIQYNPNLLSVTFFCKGNNKSITVQSSSDTCNDKDCNICKAIKEINK